ncbi:50S ribosomal protein L11 methyltransferase [Candidatus Sumerlaeota bacterium]|nr:50S ribosomal protein L11 methyltransferase [Candidatus Sumerlaeota bacterium]
MSDKQWPVINLRFAQRPSRDAWDLLCARLTAETDCLGMQEIFNTHREALSPVPEGIDLYFPAATTAQGGMEARHSAVESIASSLLPEGSFSLKGSSLTDQDWGHGWREYFKTIRVGERLYVRPPWEQMPEGAPDDALSIQIDPGQAFGTGSHETTQLCLKLLETEIAGGACLLDVGAGSGILGIGAILLGAKYCVGVECDPVCEENFLLNAELNGVKSRMMFILDDDPSHAIETARGRGAPAVDVIVCNMLSERFYDLLPALRRVGRRLILSGFLLSESECVRNSVEKAGFKVLRADSLDEWEAFICDPV